MNTKQILENHIVNIHNISKACDEIREVEHHRLYDISKVRKELEERAKEAFVDALEKRLIDFEYTHKTNEVDEAKEFFGLKKEDKVSGSIEAKDGQLNGSITLDGGVKWIANKPKFKVDSDGNLSVSEIPKFCIYESFEPMFKQMCLEQMETIYDAFNQHKILSKRL